MYIFENFSKIKLVERYFLSLTKAKTQSTFCLFLNKIVTVANRQHLPDVW